MGENTRNTPYSDIKVFYHTDRIEKLLKGERVAPIYIRIKPTNICNQNCYYCVYANDEVFNNREVDKQVSIPWNKMEEIIYDMDEMGVKAMTFSGGGEPLCYHSIIPALELIREKGIDYSMITNGQALEGKVVELLAEAKWVRVSLDSGLEDTYKKIRGVNTFNKVLKNICAFSKLKSKDTTLGINCVITQDNYLQVYKIASIAKECGVDNIKFAPLFIKDNIPEYHSKISEEVDEQLRKAERELETEDFKIVNKYTGDALLNGYSKQYQRCLIKEMFTVIGADARLYYCHQRAYIEDAVIGDLNTRRLQDVWFSDETTRKFKEFNVKETCDFRCVFDERNLLMNQLFDLDKNHINFI